MPLTFLNGGDPGGTKKYLGFSFTTGADLINQIETTLNTAGWTTISHVGDLLIVEGSDAGDNCYFSFEYRNDETTIHNCDRLEIQGYDDSVGTNKSGSDNHCIPFIVGVTNKLFLVADEGGGVISIIPNHYFVSQSVHFGFLDREDNTDDTAIAIGRPFTRASISSSSSYLQLRHRGNAPSTTSGNAYLETYFLGNLHSTWSGEIWENLGFNLGSSITSTSGASTALPAGIFPSYTGYEVASSTYPRRNLEYGVPYGLSNVYRVENYYYTENIKRTSPYTSIGSDMTSFSIKRGNVRFVINGLNSVGDNEQFNTTDGKVYMTTSKYFNAVRIA